MKNFPMPTLRGHIGNHQSTGTRLSQNCHRVVRKWFEAVPLKKRGDMGSHHCVSLRCRVASTMGQLDRECQEKEAAENELGYGRMYHCEP